MTTTTLTPIAATIQAAQAAVGALRIAVQDVEYAATELAVSGNSRERKAAEKKLTAAVDRALELQSPAATPTVDDVAQRITLGVDLPTSFADAVQGLLGTVAGDGCISVRTYAEDGSSVSEPVTYLLRGVTSDPVWTRDGEPHLLVLRADDQGVAISRSVEGIPLDTIHTLHVF